MQKLPDIKSDFSGWYNEVIYKAELVDEGPSRGSMVIRPYGYAIWENIVKILDRKIKRAGAHNAYFPLFIPESFITKEAKHVEGFAPELAVVTHAGGKKLEEALVVRPTSETMVYHMFSRWVKSWRDLPLKINQWANVVRWEMRTRPFLRSTEFLWQEGHTAHYTKEEAEEMARLMLSEYQSLAEKYLAIPVTIGEKSATERFAGADHTYTFEGMMQDGKALQMGTSHVLAQSFPEAFGVKFQDKDGVMRAPFCTSWGATTRLICALVMVHGDQNGLVLPPRIAPITAVIVPILKKGGDNGAVLEAARKIKIALESKGLSVVIDDDEKTSPGAKFFHWELKGVPVRIELGPRDLEKGHVVVVNRAEQDKEKKKDFIPLDNVAAFVPELCDTIHHQLFARAQNYIKAQWHQADVLADFGPTMEKQSGFIKRVGVAALSAKERSSSTKEPSVACLMIKAIKAALAVATRPPAMSWLQRLIRQFPGFGNYLGHQANSIE